jgi:hypothetical protein
MESIKQKAGSLKTSTKLKDPWQIWLEWGGKRPKVVKSETKRGDNNTHQGNPGNHQRLLWEPIFQWIWKSWRNGQISRYLWPSKTEPRGY